MDDEPEVTVEQFVDKMRTGLDKFQVYAKSFTFSTPLTYPESDLFDTYCDWVSSYGVGGSDA